LIDEKTIAKCLKGNKRAQKALFKFYAKKMFVHCYRYMKSKEDAEEMVSDGFVKVFQNLDSFVYKDLKSLDKANYDQRMSHVFEEEKNYFSR